MDGLGIGGNLVTCAKDPKLGMVMKLVECNGQGCMKLSEEQGKETLPFRKQYLRVLDNSIPVFDILAMIDEKLEDIT